MILVTGTKRSGTSMWMQILINSGFPFIGAAYMGVWKESILKANKKGFFESRLRNGINYHINPNPDNGAFLHPKTTIKHAVKVFTPGLVKTELAFIHRVIATVRTWNEYCSSITRLLDIEEEYILSQPDKQGEPSSEIKAVLHRGSLHPALVWWRENFDLLFDAMSRRYPINIIAYDRLLENPEDVIPKVLHWCNQSIQADFFIDKSLQIDVEAGIKTVDKSMRTQQTSQIPEHPIPKECIPIFEELYDCFYTQGAEVTAGFRERLNQTNEKLTGLIIEQERAGRMKKVQKLVQLGCTEEEVRKLLRPRKR